MALPLNPILAAVAHHPRFGGDRLPPAPAPQSLPMLLEALTGGFHPHSLLHLHANHDGRYANHIGGDIRATGGFRPHSFGPEPLAPHPHGYIPGPPSTQPIGQEHPSLGGDLVPHSHLPGGFDQIPPGPAPRGSTGIGYVAPIRRRVGLAMAARAV